jgi:hypothetical protein
MRLISEEIIDGLRVTEYENDNGEISRMEEDIGIPFSPPVKDPNPTIEDIMTQNLLNTEFLVIMSELNNM